MSVAAAAAGGSGDGNGGGDDDKKKSKLDNIPDSSSASSDLELTDEEVDLSNYEPLDLSNYEAKRRLDFLSLTTVEKTLPQKRALSSYYQGKSKSFGNLAELGAEDAKDLEKEEHPLNKKRRLMIAHEIRDKELSGGATSSSNIPHASSLPDRLPLLPKYDDDDDDDDEKKASDDHDPDDDDDVK